MKQTILISIILLAIISLSTVSAQNNLTDIASDDYSTQNIIKESEINSSNNLNESSNIGSFDEISYELTDCENGSTITLNKDYIYQYSYLIIKKEVTIDGQGHTLDAKNKTQFMEIKCNNVLLKNINFINGNTQHNPAILIKGENCTILNCSFNNNYGIDFSIVDFNYGNGSIINSTFSNTFNTEALILNTACNVINCTFLNNNGGAVTTYSDSHIFSNCEFINNSAENGGAINIFGSVKKIINCTFENNTAKNGGAIYSINPINVINCKFKTKTDTITKQTETNTTPTNTTPTNTTPTNTTPTNTTPTNTTPTNTTPTNTTPTNTTPTNTTPTNTTPTNTTPTNTTPTNTTDSKEELNTDKSFKELTDEISNIEDKGTLILNDNYTNFDTLDRITIRKQIILEGQGHTINANKKSGIFNLEADNIQLNNIKFINANNGAIIIEGKNIKITNCTFINNTNNNGGAITSKYEITIENCHFENNTANEGGAIYLDNNGEVTNCTFINNYAKNNGGALYIITKVIHGVILNNCKFDKNSADIGGALFLKHDEIRDGYGLWIHYCNFTNNHASQLGAVIYGEYVFSVKSCNFINNTNDDNKKSVISWSTYKDQDGFICFENGPYLYNCLLENNSGVNFDTKQITIVMNKKAYLDEAYDNTSDWHNAAIYIISPKNITGQVYIFTGYSEKYYSDSILEEGDKKIFYTYLEDVPPGKYVVELDYILPCGHISTYGIITTSITDDRRNWNMDVKYPTEINSDYESYTYYDQYRNKVIYETLIIKNLNEVKGDIKLYLDDEYIGYYSDYQYSNGYELDYAIPTSSCGEGNHTFTLEFLGDDEYKPVNKTVNFYIGQITTYHTNEHIIIDVASNLNGKLIIKANGIEQETKNITRREINEYYTQTGIDAIYSKYYSFGFTYGNWKILEIKYIEIIFNGTNYNFYKKIDFNPALINNVNLITSIINSPKITTTYNSGKYLIVTLKDENNEFIKNANITINLNGNKTQLKTNEIGQAKITTDKLAPKTYTVTISYDGGDFYKKSTITTKVIVKKATPKLTAAKKTFKKSVKTKKYTITLKTNKNKIIKNTKVTLKVKGNTYIAKTNSKGIATFKITKLTKKGTYKATITYKGNNYYNKKTVNTKLIIK